MPAERLVLRSRRVVTGDGVTPADVVVEGERIVGVAGLGAARCAAVDLGELVLMPGMVDPHVHINEPGRTEWEGFAHATRAAAAGGATTLADMPLNSDPVTVNVAALAAKRAAAAGQCWVDVGLHAGLVPENARRPEVLAALQSAGVLAWKAFLCDSGIPDFGAVTRDDLEAAMPVLAAAGARLLVHAELVPAPGAAGLPGAGRGYRGLADDDVAQGGAGSSRGAASNPGSYRDWEVSRPPEWELDAIELLISLGRATGCALHIVHLSAAGALPLLRQARSEGLAITVETCPHYLHFAAEDLPDGDARFKCAPPIRGRENREALWAALADGTLDLVASDHSPCPPALKATPDGDLGAAWGGIASLQLTLPVVWTGARSRGLGLERLAAWLCRRPAELLGLEHDRGAIAPGHLASLLAWDPEASFVVDPARLLNRHPSTTPYAGERLHGVIERTWLRGREVARRGEVDGEPSGRLVTRAHRPAGRDAPAIGSETPATRSAAPAIGSEAPATGSVAPAIGTDAPATGSEARAALALAALRQLPERERRDLLTRCCAACAWVDAMLRSLAAPADRMETATDEALASRSDPPTAATGGRADLLALADRAFDALRRDDWLEAFAGHPRIGDLESLRHRLASTGPGGAGGWGAAALAAGEQAGTRGASDRVLRALAEGNADYERRFGHVFIVCATGKSADEMLDLLHRRLTNDADTELAIAAGEQRKITRLRLERLVLEATPMLPVRDLSWP